MPIPYGDYQGPVQDFGPRPIRLLEFNRPAHSPWLTVPLAEEEIVIQHANEAEVFRQCDPSDI